MTKTQYDQLEEALTKRGYKKYFQNWKHEDWALGKEFHKQDNRWEEDRAAYQVTLSVYNYTDKLYAAHDQVLKYRVGMEVTVVVSRTICERIDMSFAWEDDTTIEQVEKLAESFYSWVSCVIPEPRED